MTGARFVLSTEFDDDQIVQKLDFIVNDTRAQIYRQVAQLADAAVREALIQLGWTPPL